MSETYEEDYRELVEMLQRQWFENREPPTDASDPGELDDFLQMLEDVSEVGREYRIHAMEAMDNE